jgi:hypothetical protein
MKRALMTILTLSLLAGCGGNLDQQEAREKATELSCDRAARCGNIGQGEQYADRDDCEVQFNGIWNNQWSKAACDGNIREDDLQVCLNAISNTLCNNEVDEATTFFVKCSQEQVCNAGN